MASDRCLKVQALRIHPTLSSFGSFYDVAAGFNEWPHSPEIVLSAPRPSHREQF